MSGKSVMVLVRTLFDGLQGLPEVDPGVDCSVDPDTGEELVSLTKQEFADDCDINVIMARYEKTGVIDHVNRRQPEFGDFADMVDYQTALNIVNEADSRFSDLPASVRARFENDPRQLLAFVADPANRDEAMDLGLIERPAEPPPVVEPPAAPPAPAPQPAA